MKYYFVGHESFGNRGCEALIRSIVSLVRSVDPEAEFLCPSRSPELDGAQWPNAAQAGVRFVRPVPFPEVLRWWGRAVRVAPPLAAFGPPPYPMHRDTAEETRDADVVIVTGGDIFSEEYGAPSVYSWVRLADQLIDAGKPAILWGGSVGPFSDPAMGARVASHLNRYAAVTVREADTSAYLIRLGVRNVELVGDPAFVLEPEPFDCDALTFKNSPNLVGVNISPLVSRLRAASRVSTSLADEVAEFLRGLAKEDDSRRFVLVPHVDPQASGWNSDSAALSELSEKVGISPERLLVAPATLNAAQLKHLISKCRFFIGARTHATIAAFSTGVPTLSLAYSTKARGINKQLFGHEEYLIDIRALDARQLANKFASLQSAETEIRQALVQGADVARGRARSVLEVLRTADRGLAPKAA